MGDHVVSVPLNRGNHLLIMKSNKQESLPEGRKKNRMQMKTQSTVLDNASKEPTIHNRILQTALAAWRQGNLVEVVEQFSDQFTFADHALELEFKDKGRLTEFLAKIRELF